MALMVRKLYQAYFWVFDTMADHRTDNMPFFSSPFGALSVGIGYLYLVHKLGPKLMENRKPFEIKNLIRAYNIVQVLANSYVLYLSVVLASRVSWECAEIDYSNSPDGLNELHIAWTYFFLKIFDLVDTIFFLLRKSYRQISFLHTYHHFAMVEGVWMGARFFPGGNGVWIAVINCFVHVIMFTYYFLSTLDDKWKNNLTLKKALTQLQLIQFATFIFLFGRVFFQPDCGYPRLVSYIFVPQNAFMLLLFGDFYLKTYVFKKKKAVKSN